MKDNILVEDGSGNHALLRLLSQPHVASLLASVLLYAACLGMLHPAYAINDDVKIISILAGYPAGSPAPFPVFSNVLWGLALVPLYGLHTAINWEIWLFLILDVLSTWALLYMLFSGARTKSERLLGGSIILASSIYFALNITFTNAAGFACFAGLCLIVASSRTAPRLKWAPALGGIALVFVGSLIRLEMLALSLPLVVTAIVFLFRRLQLRILGLVLACAALAIAFGWAFNRLYVRAHPDWNAFYFYNGMQQQLLDAHRLENVGALIKRISWSKNDQELMARAFYPDAGTYSVERIRYLVEHVPGTASNPASSVASFWQRVAGANGLPTALLIASIWLLALARRSSWLQLLGVTALALAPLVENVFLIWIYKDPDYVLFPSLAETAILMVIFIAWPNPESPGIVRARLPGAAWTAPGFLTLVAALAVLIGRANAVSNTNALNQTTYRQILADLERLQSNGRLAPDAIIISPSHGIPVEWANPLTLDFPAIPYWNMGWTTFSPAYDQTLQHYDLAPLPDALIHKNNVYVMTKRVFQTYLGIYYVEHERLTVIFQQIYRVPNPTHALEYEDTVLYKVQVAP